MSNTSKKVGIDVVIANLKQLLVVNKEKGLYSNAIFYADKLVHLFPFKSDEQLEAIYELGNILTSPMLYAEQRVSQGLSFD
jgi:hypothetical protein